MLVISEQSCPVPVLGQEPFTVFGLPALVDKGEQRRSLVSAWHPTKVSPSQSPNLCSSDQSLFAAMVLFMVLLW